MSSATASKSMTTYRHGMSPASETATGSSGTGVPGSMVVSLDPPKASPLPETGVPDDYDDHIPTPRSETCNPED